MKLYLVRHGETDWNKDGIAQGQTDIALNNTGRAQARELKKKVDQISISMCYSSPLRRAAETANIIVGDRMDIKCDDLLKERCFGDFEGKPSKMMRAEVLTELYSFGSTKSYNGIEPMSSLMLRGKKILERIKAENEATDNILVVGHGTALKAIYFNVVGYDRDTDFFSWHLENS